MSQTQAEFRGMTGKTILVTGATGFTGGHLARRLARNGERVRALVRDPSRADDLERIGVDLAPGDLREPASLERAVVGVDVVYHIAALFRKETAFRREFWDTNVTGTHALLEASARAGVRRFVHCSTVGVHGEIVDPPADESTPHHPEDHYQASKAAGERLALEYAKSGNLAVSVFRPAGIYGPGDTRFFKLFRAIERGRFLMIGSGETLYQLVYIDDLIDGILLCGKRAEAVGEVYILTGTRAVTLNHLVHEIADAVGGSIPSWKVPAHVVSLAAVLCEFLCRPLGIQPPLYRRRMDFFTKDRAFNISKARQELGFAPQVDLTTGIRLTARWYRREGWL